MTVDEIISGTREFVEYKTDRTKELEILKTMLIHSQAADPAGVILRRHPSEDEETFAWRLSNYTCITKPIFDKACNALNRIFADTTAEWSTSSNTEVFLMEKRFDGSRFDHFFQKHVLKVMLEDPNAWLVTHPRLPVPEVDNQKIDVDMTLVRTTHQFHKSKSCIIWCEEPIYDLSRHKSLSDSIQYYNRSLRSTDIPTNTYYHIVTRTQYAIIYLSKPDGSVTAVPQLVASYDHLTDDLLYTSLGGKMTIDGCFESYFTSFVAFGNEALKSYSDYQLIRKNSAYPIKEMRSIDCMADGCSHGNIYDDNGSFIRKCGACGGSGKQIHFSPSSIIVRPEADPGGAGVVDTSPMLTYHSPDVGILQNAAQDWKDLLDMALNALNLNFVLEAQSGVAKSLDRQELYSMVAEIGHNVYDALIYDQLFRIEKLRERVFASEPVIIKPSHYNIDTEDRLNEQFQFFSQVKGLAFVKIETFRRAMQRMHSGNPKVMKMIDVLIAIDPFITMDIDEIGMAKVLGVATEFDIFTTMRCNSVLRRLVEDRDLIIKTERKKGDSVRDYLMGTTVADITDDLRERLTELYLEHKNQMDIELYADDGNELITTDADTSTNLLDGLTNEDKLLFETRIKQEMDKSMTEDSQSQ